MRYTNDRIDKRLKDYRIKLHCSLIFANIGSRIKIKSRAEITCAPSLEDSWLSHVISSLQIVTISLRSLLFTFILLESKLILLLFSTTLIFLYYTICCKKNFTLSHCQANNRLSSKLPIFTLLVFKITLSIKKTCMEKGLIIL